MPVITNRLAKGRPIETKRALAQAFTKAAAESFAAGRGCGRMTA